MIQPSFQVERRLWKKGYKRVAGLDETGRGALCGPVVACAVMISNNSTKSSLLHSSIPFADSKKLSAKRREEFYKILTKHPSIKWGIGRVSEKVIDKINIKNAAELAMEKAILKLKEKPDFLIIDGKHLANLKLKTYNLKLIIKADEKVFSCTAASIIAKVIRDRIMRRYHKKYPRYSFNKHKGYPTKLHLRILKRYGPCKIHRRSFKPLKRFN